MSVNARKEEYEHVELFGKPALFTSSRIDRSTVPKGFSCYDLRGSDYDPGRPVTVQNFVVVNHAGTVLTPEPIPFPEEGFRRLRGKLNFLGECMILADFCEEHGLKLPLDDRNLIIRPASPEESGLFYAHELEKERSLGCVGSVRIDFGHKGKEFWHTWWPSHDKSLNTPEFKETLNEVVNGLRESLLKDLAAMSEYCNTHDGKIDGGYQQNYGYVVDAGEYCFCIRCTPVQGDYNAYIFSYDKRAQEMNMSDQNEPGQGTQMGGMTLG
ncbi:LPD28 domain-containing protein [Lacrimispora defluvii]|uniref:Large polyvalent protein associated domain-containing protein n=1 Tax=Lacrimispora defluvii TaxID=2719233 RepID=A0ABX1VQM6_9FIRM|nr:LPD28 domain-containing protein [Lacrimispora defluvii]NNJ28576.1 hypothetical protein [Lacrimispora defluvii]